MIEQQKKAKCEHPTCAYPATFVVKVHQRSEPLLGPPGQQYCFVHAVSVLLGQMHELQDNQDVMGITVNLP